MVIPLITRLKISVSNDVRPRGGKHEVLEPSRLLRSGSIWEIKCGKLRVFRCRSKYLYDPVAHIRRHLLPRYIGSDLMSNIVPGEDRNDRKKDQSGQKQYIQTRFFHIYFDPNGKILAN